jgi:hypothetical protein
MAKLVAIVREEHQESTTASADEFPSDGTVPYREVVPLVDFRIAHAAGALLLVLPVLMHQLPEPNHVSGLQRFLAAIPEILDVVQVVKHFRVVVLGTNLLVL